MKCPECGHELAVEVCDLPSGQTGFYWICPDCNHSSRCMTDDEFDVQYMQLIHCCKECAKKLRVALGVSQTKIGGK